LTASSRSLTKIHQRLLTLRLVQELCWEVHPQGYVQFCHLLQQKCRSCWAVPEIKKMIYIIFKKLEIQFY
jgi:hypothetical protein